jgi:hypothetical protein
MEAGATSCNPFGFSLFTIHPHQTTVLILQLVNNAVNHPLPRHGILSIEDYIRKEKSHET